MRHVRLLLVLTLVGVVTGGSVAAGADAAAVEIHGYGGWAYGRNDAEGVTYLASSHEGEADYVNLALAFASHASDRAYINAQVWWEAEPGEEEKAVVDYVFGEWRFSDALRLRMGQVKHPYGIYTEVFDVGTIRPFFWLAQSVYGPTGTVAESYHGLGLTGSGFADSGFEFEYDLYAGELDLEFTDLAALLATAEGGEAATEGEAEAHLRDLVGGRLTVTMPGCGVRLGVSAYAGQDDDAEPNDARHTSAGAHAEYLTQSWSVRSEYSRVRDRQETSSDAFYLEAARRLGEAWQLAARYDRFAARMSEVDTDAAPSLLEHREVTLGLNYWFHPDLVAKLALSDIEGHRFARPEDLADAVADGGLPQRIRHFSLGVQFAF